MKLKLLSHLLTSLIILPLAMPLASEAIAPTRSQTNPNLSQLAPAETFTPATINGKLDSNSQTFKDKTYYNTHTFEWKAGEQITIDLTSSEFTPRLYLLDSQKKRIAANYGSGNNATITVTLPTTDTYYILPNAAEAGKTGNYTLSWREATADDLELAEAEKLNQQIVQLDNQGKYDAAIPLAESALEIRKRILGEKHLLVANSLNRLALLYQNQGRYAEAEPFFLQALAIFKEILPEKHLNVAISLNNLAGLYRSLGRYTEAEPLYLESLAIRKEILPEKDLNVATSLYNLAGLYRNQGRYTEAEPLYRQALAIRKELLPEKHPDIAIILNSLAVLYQYQGKYTEAEPLYLESLAMNKEFLGEKHPLVALTLNNLAALYDSQGRYNESESLHLEALAIRKEFLPENHPSLANSLNNLANLYEAKGDITRAIEYLTQGTDIQEINIDTTLSVGSERQKQEYMATISSTTDSTISLHTQSAPNNPEAIRLALTIILRRKGRILDAVTDNLKLIRQNITPENQKLLDELVSTRAQLAALIFNKPTNLSIEEYRNQIANLKIKADAQESELARRSAQFRTASQPVTIETIQKLIPANTALVEIVQYKPFNPKAKPGERFGKPYYAAYIIHSTGEPKWVDLGEAQPINQSVTEFRTSLQTQSLLIKKIARNLDEKVMKPIRPLLGNTKNILLSPDSQLNLIPFAALIDENNQYLVENYSINYLTTGRDLIRLQNHGESKDNPLLMADVDFNQAETSPPAPRLQGERSQTSPPAPLLQGEGSNQENISLTPPFPPLRGSKLRREGGLGGLGENRRSSEIDQLQFNPLPGTKAEAEAIAPLLKNVTLLTGSQATENALKQIKSPPILHIATHGFFLRDLELVASANFNEDRGLGVVPRFDNPKNLSPNQTENPLLRSGIVLAGGNKRQSGDEDGVLTALETTYLRLYGTKLVVLSACQTGVGDAENGEGVYGLRRALVIAGAESQLMSLWSVSDEGTKELMVKYYTRLLRNEGRSEALRQVQLEMLKNKQLQHPYFWSAFIPSGDWRGVSRF